MSDAIMGSITFAPPVHHRDACDCQICQKLRRATGEPEIRRPLMKANKDRTPNDQYFTPVPLALAICDRLSKIIPAPVNVLEPGVGGGAFLKAIRAVWKNSSVAIEDVDPKMLAEHRAEKKGGPGSTGNSFDAIVGNPPFGDAERQVRLCLERLAFGGHLAFILRLAFLASQTRAELYRSHPIRYLIPIIGRPSFQADGATEMSEYGVFVWRKGWAGNAEILPGLEWKKGRS